MTSLCKALHDYAPDQLGIIGKKPEIGDLPISNFDTFCRYPVKNYLASMDFVRDFEICKDDYIEAIDLGKEPFLFLFRNSDTSIVLRIAYGEPESTPAQ